MQKGFTLIELLLYIAIMTVLLVVLGGIGINVTMLRAKGYALAEVAYNTVMVSERLHAAIEGAESVVGPLAGATGTTLTLEMSDPAKDPTIFTFAEGMLTIREGAGTATPAHTASVRMRDAVFSNLSYAGSDTVRAIFTVAVDNPDNRREYEAEQTVYITGTTRP